MTNYIKQISFWFDLVSTIPLAEIVDFFVSNSSNTIIKWLKPLKVFRIFRLTKLSKFLKSSSAKTIFNIINIGLAFCITVSYFFFFLH